MGAAHRSRAGGRRAVIAAGRMGRVRGRRRGRHHVVAIMRGLGHFMMAGRLHHRHWHRHRRGHDWRGRLHDEQSDQDQAPYQVLGQCRAKGGSPVFHQIQIILIAMNDKSSFGERRGLPAFHAGARCAPPDGASRFSALRGGRLLARPSALPPARLLAFGRAGRRPDGRASRPCRRSHAAPPPRKTAP